ncbi:MAG TPA: GNAT family N-acetyltransferase [Actinomycetota bacterium]|nr:GNAT family N-acetyltransferase [Actinomycetota bacterium]
MITLRGLQDSDRDAVMALRLAPGQRRFVSTVPESLAEAAEEPGAKAITWAVYRDETPVGFVMIADEVEEPYISHYLWKLLIDERYQRQGVGTATLDLVVQYFLDRPGVDAITTSAVEGDGSPIPFYERYGFERTGEMHDEEVVLRLDLRKHEAPGSEIEAREPVAPEDL